MTSNSKNIHPELAGDERLVRIAELGQLGHLADVTKHGVVYTSIRTTWHKSPVHAAADEYVEMFTAWLNDRDPRGVVWRRIPTYCAYQDPADGQKRVCIDSRVAYDEKHLEALLENERLASEAVTSIVDVIARKQEEDRNWAKSDLLRFLNDEAFPAFDGYALLVMRRDGKNIDTKYVIRGCTSDDHLVTKALAATQFITFRTD